MINKIIKSTPKQTIAAIKSRDFSEVNKIKETATQAAADVFLAVASGSVPLIWYDLPPVRCQSGAVSVMRYALHKSTKRLGYLQLSCMEIKDGRMIPTSDRQYNITDGGFCEFFRGRKYKIFRAVKHCSFSGVLHPLRAAAVRDLCGTSPGLVSRCDVH